MHERKAVRSSCRGFTLMEMIVAITIFSTLIVAATDIFLLASRTQRKVFDLESMQASARYTMEAMVREVRTGVIDLDYYAGRAQPLGTPDTELALIDSEGDQIRFFESDASTEADCPNENSRPCLLVAVGVNPPAPISPKGIRVRSVSFYVSPDVDPFAFNSAAGSYLSNIQPSVTIVMSFESASRKIDERTYTYLQTTATSRRYER
ncbi:MAG: prepilin-type N-terminal cleavage/methylation domain-containing protein [Patescibacteria group bacterium]|nr:prepilin-type N-terminal cleavage/methylation domain-containing protein [Patescibacteria group bacterium]